MNVIFITGFSIDKLMNSFIPLFFHIRIHNSYGVSKTYQKILNSFLNKTAPNCKEEILNVDQAYNEKYPKFFYKTSDLFKYLSVY